VCLHSSQILVLGMDEERSIGEWRLNSRLIRLNQAYIARADTQPADVASVIVHEATHAWLDDLGFEYGANFRQRIEAICYRASAAFARRIPDGGDLAAVHERCAEMVLEQSRDEWSTATRRVQGLTELRNLGAPDWLVRLVSRSWNRDS